MKKLFIILCFFILISNICIAATPNFDVHCNSAILIDARTGNVLYEKNSNKQAYPASTTKILTAYIALSQNQDMNTEIIPSRNSVMSVPSGSSIAYFSENEKLTLEQVLFGLLLPSGNDAANILAEHISGSNANFAELMNVTAEKLGATNSHFTNPSGLHDNEHYTTAADLAKIAYHVMKIPKFKEIVSQSRYTMPKTNVSKTDRTFINTNKLLTSGEYYYESATGIKTGYTSQAGNCLVSSASKDGVELIAVVLGGHTIPVGKSAIYTDTINLFNFGFSNYHNNQLVAPSNLITTVVPKKSGKQTLELITDSPINVLVENGDTPTFEKIISLNEKIVAPIKKGDVLGTLTYTKNEEIAGIVNLVAKTDIEKEHWFWVALKILISFVVSVIILCVFLRLFNDIKKNIKKRRKLKLWGDNYGISRLFKLYI